MFMNEQQLAHANRQFQIMLNNAQDQKKRSAVLVAQAQFLLFYINDHPEKVQPDLVKELEKLIDTICSFKFRDPRVERMFSAASISLAAITATGAADPVDGVRILARSLVEEAASIEFGVAPSDPVGVIGWYMTNLVIPLLKMATLVILNTNLLLAINAVRVKLGLPQISA